MCLPTRSNRMYFSFYFSFSKRNYWLRSTVNIIYLHSFLLYCLYIFPEIFQISNWSYSPTCYVTPWRNHLFQKWLFSKLLYRYSFCYFLHAKRLKIPRSPPKNSKTYDAVLIIQAGTVLQLHVTTVYTGRYGPDAVVVLAALVAFQRRDRDEEADEADEERAAGYTHVAGNFSGSLRSGRSPVCDADTTPVADQLKPPTRLPRAPRWTHFCDVIGGPSSRPFLLRCCCFHPKWTRFAIFRHV